jgi:hypothetical protein
LGDEILESTPCFIVSERLAKLLVKAKLTGFELADVDVTLSEDAEELAGGPIDLPNFQWLQLVGRPNVDDFAADDKGSLVVSEAALAILKKRKLENCGVEGL